MTAARMCDRCHDEVAVPHTLFCATCLNSIRVDIEPIPQNIEDSAPYCCPNCGDPRAGAVRAEFCSPGCKLDYETKARELLRGIILKSFGNTPEELGEFSP